MESKLSDRVTELILSFLVAECDYLALESYSLTYNYSQ